MMRLYHCFYVAALVVMAVLFMYKGFTAPDSDPWLTVRCFLYALVMLTLALFRLPEAMSGRGRFDP